MTVQIFDQYYPSKMGFDNFSKVEDFLKNRQTEKYIIKGIVKIDIIGGEFYFTLEIQEPESVGIEVREFYMPKHTINHLFRTVDIPTALLGYYDTLNTSLPDDQRKEAFEYESKNLSNLYGARIEKQLTSKRTKDMYLHVVEDGFGKYPRAITSEDYIHYADSDALADFQFKVDDLNKRDKSDYEFSMAMLTPFSTRVGYINDTIEIMKEEISTGFCWLNSEMKRNSFQLLNQMIRLLCSNGMFSRTGGDNIYRIPHKGENFELKQAVALNGIITLEDKFTEAYQSLERYSKNPISDKWDDLYQLPTRYLAMKKGEKSELIEIAEKQEYEFTPYGIVQALTWKSSHKANSLEEVERLNNKANDIIFVANSIASWKPLKAVA